MEEEKREVVEENQEVEVVEEAKEEPKAVENNEETNKNVLVAFILACVSLTVCAGWILGGIAAVITGLLSLNRQKDIGEVKQHPYKVFIRIAKPVAMVGAILGLVLAIVYTITFIVELFK